MTTWKFSDGTIVRLGGEVEGASIFAQELRAELARPNVGVQLWPHPSEGVDLDRNDLMLLDTWLRAQLAKPYRSWMMVELVSAPKNIPPLPPPPWGDEPADPNVIY